MTIFVFTVLVAVSSFMAGLVGALTGLGGGVVLVPLLTIVFGVDIRYAIGASLISVIATSSGAAAAYVREGYSNIRIGMFLEIATMVSARAIAVIFGVVLLVSAYLSGRKQREQPTMEECGSLSEKLRLSGTYPTPNGPRSYCVCNVPAGFSLMFTAGTLSGLLGIGSGAVKVLAMDQAMRIPFKVSTTTSNFMIGVTAAASAGLYLSRGYIDPGLAMPVMLGVLGGSMLGAKLLVKAKTKSLRLVFSVVIVALGIEMIINGIRGSL